MKKVKVEEAVGLTLCHDITQMKDGFKGPVFTRGHVIQAEDIPTLLDVGKRSVFIWEENAGEIHEEDAALRMEKMISLPYSKAKGPSEGKILLFAEQAGLFRVDKALLRQINSIEDLTICSLPDHYPVAPGDRLVSMRIVPLVTRESRIEQAESLCRGRRLFDLHPYQEKKIGVIITGSEVYSGRIRDKFEPVVRAKMKKFPAQILGVTLCDDDTDMILQAARKHLQEGADFLIFTGGMSVDPDDLTPSAIGKLGADIITHGVPAQPGNMTLVAYLGDIPILGVPGAAISLPTTMFDVLLPQIFAGDRITKEELTELGDGGLCQMCAQCHWPNCSFGRY